MSRLKMQREAPVYIVVPIHNNLESTRRCLENIRELTYKNFRTVVVDDGSTDGSFAYITGNFPEVILLKGDGNLWWSGAVNKGVEYALNNGADYICLLNNDNTFKNDFLSVLVKTAERPGVDAVCSKVFYKDTDVVFHGGTARSKWGELLMLDGKDREEFRIEKSVEWITGMGVLIKSQVFKNMGRFDQESFPHYYGDADFGLKMTNLGYAILYQPESVIYNDHESTGISYYSGKLKDLYRTLFSIKSSSNIRICFRFYRKHSPRYVFVLTLKSILRVFYGYFRTIITKKSRFDLKKNK